MNEFWNGTLTLKVSHLCIYLIVCLVCLILSIIFSYVSNKPVRKIVKQRALLEKELARNCVSVVEEWANSTFAIYSKAYSILWDKMLPDVQVFVTSNIRFWGDTVIVKFKLEGRLGETVNWCPEMVYKASLSQLFEMQKDGDTKMITDMKFLLHRKLDRFM